MSLFNMKPIMDWKLSPAELRDGMKAFNDFVKDVVAQSAPYKVKATFIKSSRCSMTALVEVDGKQHWISHRYTYFNIFHPEAGEEVYVDNRHFQNSPT